MHRLLAAALLSALALPAAAEVYLSRCKMEECVYYEQTNRQVVGEGSRVVPGKLVSVRLRAAAVIISLATGPYRSQEPDWQRETLVMVDAAEALVRQVV